MAKCIFNEGIKEGDKFLCFKTMAFDRRPESIFFRMGKVYTSYFDGKIEDEEGNKLHSFTRKFWRSCLIKLNEEEEIDMSSIKDLPLGDKILIRSLVKKYQQKSKQL